MLGTDSYKEAQYYAVDYYDTDEVFYDARSCFSESYISDYDLKDKLFAGDYPPFVLFDGQLAWEVSFPNPSSIYDFENAGVVSYSDTEAEIWVFTSPFDFYDCAIEIFEMTRYDSHGSWKIDKHWFALGSDIDNKREVEL